MANRVKKSDLTKREKYLLGLVEEKSFANRMFISIETLHLWTDLGLPFIWYGRKKFFDLRDVWDWLESPNVLCDGKNIDLVWKMTPAIMRPYIASISGHDILPDGNYIILPADIKKKAK